MNIGLEGVLIGQSKKAPIASMIEHLCNVAIPTGQRAGVAIQARNAGLPDELVQTMQLCGDFNGATT